jgi:hypothetical protein
MSPRMMNLRRERRPRSWNKSQSNSPHFCALPSSFHFLTLFLSFAFLTMVMPWVIIVCRSTSSLVKGLEPCAAQRGIAYFAVCHELFHYSITPPAPNPLPSESPKLPHSGCIFFGLYPRVPTISYIATGFTTQST